MSDSKEGTWNVSQNFAGYPEPVGMLKKVVCKKFVLTR